MSGNPPIRDALPGDEAEWRSLWRGFLDYYDQSHSAEVENFTWARLMSATSPLSCRLAIRGERAVGFAIHQHHPSTWVMGDDCYLEDLYVDPAARGMGVGRALVEDLIALARARGWHRLWWNTEADNQAARALYDRFAASDGHVRYRLVL